MLKSFELYSSDELVYIWGYVSNKVCSIIIEIKKGVLKGDDYMERGCTVYTFWARTICSFLDDGEGDGKGSAGLNVDDAGNEVSE